MIRKLKIKFVALAMTALFALLAVIVVGMNLINYHSVVQEADAVLSVLSQNKGAFPDFGSGPNNHLPPNMSPETPYESRYFSVFLNESGEVVLTDTSKIASVDSEAAAAYARTIVEKQSVQGFLDEYRYIFRSEPNGFRITFLDCGRSLASFRKFLVASTGMALMGYVVVFFVIFFFAGRIIRPIAESYDKQKRFITDAGHEIKTPLTIISANVDILEMELGENESLADIRQQTERLRSLTDDLVMLTRMEEPGNTMQKIDFPLSEVVAEAAHPFRTLAIQQGKEFVCHIQPMLSLNGNDKAIQQLVAILLDNALKYSPYGGTIALNLIKQNKVVHLSVFNTAATEIKRESLGRVFDRFYRTDASRSSETGGHGIGLSIAKAVVTAHGGKIQAGTQDGRSFQITVVLPV